MLPLKIVTDSTADLPSEVAAELGITVIPCLIRFGNQSFREDVDITRTEVFERLRTEPTFPSTAAPAPGVFEEAYRRLAAETDTIISIHLSARYSGVYNSARLGAQAMPNNLRVEVVDSGQVSLSMGLMVMTVAEAIQDGATLQEVLMLLDDLRLRTHLFAVPDVLDNLYRSGRINQLVARLGTLLRIKPILHVYQGEVLLQERVRSWRRAQQRLIEIVRSLAPFERVVLAHIQRPDAAQSLGNALADLLPRRTYTLEAGATISAHVGLGAAGIALVEAGEARITKSAKSREPHEARRRPRALQSLETSLPVPRAALRASCSRRVNFVLSRSRRFPGAQNFAPHPMSAFELTR